MGWAHPKSTMGAHDVLRASDILAWRTEADAALVQSLLRAAVADVMTNQPRFSHHDGVLTSQLIET